MEHYLKRLQEATRKYWDKSALNTWQGEGFTYGQVATSIERYHTHILEQEGEVEGSIFLLFSQ